MTPEPDNPLTWASYHYAVHEDLVRLQLDGGWSSVTLVTRYAHLLSEGHEGAIRRWHQCDTNRMEAGASH